MLAFAKNVAKECATSEFDTFNHDLIPAGPENQYECVATILNSDVRFENTTVKELRRACATYIVSSMNDQDLQNARVRWAGAQKAAGKDPHVGIELNAFKFHLARSIVDPKAPLPGDKTTLEIMSNTTGIGFMVLSHTADRFLWEIHPSQVTYREPVCLLSLQGNEHYSPIFLETSSTRSRQYFFLSESECLQNLRRLVG